MARTPELLDPALDQSHRSYRTAVLGEHLGILKTRTAIEGFPLDERWVPRYVVYHN